MSSPIDSYEWGEEKVNGLKNLKSAKQMSVHLGWGRN